ncbi:MAG: 6-phosphogluconolactonase [Gammaproteobacteria bacterium]|nr:6-phosphogluconolactonase [Gammaproteobacteria bacterium]
MGEALHTARWHVLMDPESVAQEAAFRILSAAKAAIAERGVFRLVLSGGHTPERAYRFLSQAEADWANWEIYFGDERCLPADDRERNSVMAAQTWLDLVPIPSHRIHAMPAELGADRAAKEYARLVREALPFDMVLLGMGEDGHTASLFPGQEHPRDELVHAVHNAPKPPPDRVTLSAPALGDTRQILLLVTGSSKRPAIQAWCQGEPVPIARIEGMSLMEVLTDQKAGL